MASGWILHARVPGTVEITETLSSLPFLAAWGLAVTCRSALGHFAPFLSLLYPILTISPTHSPHSPSSYLCFLWRLCFVKPLCFCMGSPSVGYLFFSATPPFSHAAKLTRACPSHICSSLCPPNPLLPSALTEPWNCLSDRDFHITCVPITLRSPLRGWALSYTFVSSVLSKCSIIFW